MADDGSRDRLAKLYAMVMDRNARFSARATLAELDTIGAAPGSPEAGRVAHLRAIIEMKIDRYGDVITHGEEALRIDAAHSFLTPHERMLLAYHVAKAQEKRNDCAAALPHYREALAHMAKDPGVTQEGRLGTQARIGYCLHEIRQYAEARRVDEEALAGGEKFYGPDDPQLMPVMINLAQNEYVLGDHAAARRHLEHVLAIAIAAKDAQRIDSMLFQLGVLAFEDHRPEEAQKFMQRRLDLAKASGDAKRIAAATADLEVLHEKMAR